MTRALRPGVVLGVVALAALSTLLGYAVGLQALTPIVGGLLFLMAGLVAANPGYAMVLLLSVGSSLSVGFMLGGEEAALSIADVSVDLQTAAFGFVVLTIVAVGARGFTSVPKRLHASKPAVCLGLFWVWCAFSLLWSPDLASGVRVLGQLLIICLTASGVGMLVSGHILQRFSVAKSLVVAGVLSLAWSGVALVQGRAFSTVPELPGVGRLAGSMGANTYGFFVLVTALAAWSMWGEPRRSWHIGARVWVGVSVVLVILTVSRAAWAAGLLSALGVALATRQRRVAKAAAIAVACLLFLSVLPASLNRITLDTTRGVTQQLRTGGADLEMGGWRGRAKGWDYMIRNYYLKSPVVGTGLGSTAEVFRGGTSLITGAGAPQNDYVRFLCETGLVGVLLLCATLWTTLTATWRVARSGAARETIGAAAFGAVLAAIVVSVSDNTVQLVVYFAAPIAALVAVAVAWRPADR